MNRDQPVYFTCPNCDERFARVEELDGDVHTGGDIPLRLLRRPGGVPGGVRRGLRAAAHGEEGLPLLQSPPPVRQTIQDNLRRDRKGELT